MKKGDKVFKVITLFPIIVYSLLLILLPLIYILFLSFFENDSYGGIIYNFTLSNYASIFSSIDEKGTPFPGFVFRISKDVANKYELEANSNASKETLNYYGLDDVHDVIIKRVNDILYINIDNGGDTQILDYSTFENVFYYPLTLGAGLDKDFKPWRYFKGTLSDISVTLEQ